MAITQAMCTSFKAELMLGVHDFRPYRRHRVGHV
jgi:hypothetical protein